MGFRFTGRTGQRVRRSLALLALCLAATASLLVPALTLPAILAAGALMLWDGVALAVELRALAATVLVAEPDVKLEVDEGAWGELCHALNRLLQQRRAERHLRPMLPVLPVASAARLADLSLPQEGWACAVTVLVLAHHTLPADPIAQLRATAYAALHQAQLYDALLARCGPDIVLIFGVLSQQDGAVALHGAYNAAQALSDLWAANPPDAQPWLILTSGQGRAVILPGLGLTVLGPPLEQAHALQRLASASTLVCNEPAYLGLRRLGLAPTHPTARLPAQRDSPAAFVLSLQNK